MRKLEEKSTDNVTREPVVVCVHAVEARESDEGFERLQPLAQSASFPQTTLRTLLTDLTILVQHLSCSLHGWNFQPESSKILKDDKQRYCWNTSLLRVNITVELLPLIYHIAIHIDRELY